VEGFSIGQRTGRKVRDVLAGLRRKYGDQAPNYQKFWATTQDGRITARRVGASLVIEDDDETIARVLGLASKQAA
jgi:hypothetical protein